MTDRTRISIADAKALIHAALAAAGVPFDVCTSVAAALVAAEAEGQGGHGFSRLSDYVAQARSGKINLNAKITKTLRGPSSVLIDADRGFAFPALDAALATGLPLAEKMGIAIMAVGNSHHCGALSVQVEKIAKAGMIGLMVANAPKAIAPWGAKDPVFGTNPIAFATPQATGDPLVIDMSLSRVARGKVLNAHKTNQPIPLGWALDAQGEPTTDAKAALEGTMIPIGEAKGTALALMVEILAAAFTGSAFSQEAGSFFTADGPAPRVGQTLIAIRPDANSDFLQRVSTLLDTIQAMEGARLPGTRRRGAIRSAEADGLLVQSHYLNLAKTLADSA
ncbi:MAG: Ldh family oxidoreductase [Sulfitobacter sp.]|nr:Ldh family oxidoreductase [Sulfitobacter sp.]